MLESLQGRLTLWSEYGPCGSRCNVAGLGPYQKRYRDCIDYSTWNPLFKGCAGFEREQAVLCNQDIPCKAVCSTTCNADATCTSPDTCICNTGYEGDGTTICNPVCSTTCHADATCTSPDTCICNTGYEGDGTTICNANCIPECHSNGVCANMNTCFCEKGYHGDGITSCELSKENNTLIITIIGCSVGIIVVVLAICVVLYRKRSPRSESATEMHHIEQQRSAVIANKNGIDSLETQPSTTAQNPAMQSNLTGSVEDGFVDCPIYEVAEPDLLRSTQRNDPSTKDTQNLDVQAYDYAYNRSQPH